MPRKPAGSPLELFLARTEINPDGCWHWTGHIDKGGYGMLFVNHTNMLAHRFAYQFFEGPIPPGLQVDHLCRNRACVNPSHLQLLTNRENCQAGNTGKHNLVKTQCPQGHLYTKENTYIYHTEDGRALRACRLCHANRERERRELCAQSKT